MKFHRQHWRLFSGQSGLFFYSAKRSTEQTQEWQEDEGVNIEGQLQPKWRRVSLPFSGRQLATGLQSRYLQNLNHGEQFKGHLLNRCVGGITWRPSLTPLTAVYSPHWFVFFLFFLKKIQRPLRSPSQFRQKINKEAHLKVGPALINCAVWGLFCDCVCVNWVFCQAWFLLYWCAVDAQWGSI